MNGFWLAAALFCAAAGAFQPREVAVKITSHDLHTDRKFIGSGMLFRRGGQAYAITSDHVLLHTNRNCTHWIQTPKLGEKSATYLASDWGKGIGLLKVDGLDGVALPEYADLAPQPVTVDEKIQIVGYPLDSTSPIVDKRGHVDQPEFSSPLFVDIPALIHIVRTHGEFGMSGGPLFSSAGHFLGILSHQILKDAPVPQNELLIIPGAVIWQWLEEYFADPAKPHSAFAQPPGLQYYKEPSIASRDQEFDYLRAFDRGWDVAISDLEQDLGSRAPEDASHFLDHAQQFAHANRRNGNTVYVFYFRPKGDFWSSAYTGYTGLVDFFRKLKRPDLEPVAITGINSSDKILEQVYKIANGLSVALEPFRNLVGGPGSLLANRLIFLGYAMEEQHPGEETYRYARVKPGDLQDLLEGESYRDEWRAFDEKASWAADNLRECLKKLIPLFQKLTV